LGVRHLITVFVCIWPPGDGFVYMADMDVDIHWN